MKKNWIGIGFKIIQKVKLRGEEVEVSKKDCTISTIVIPVD
jgi:predicted DNA-binding antitoxin AbrB/MazE fold protein